jgi:hypothetical protein
VPDPLPVPRRPPLPDLAQLPVLVPPLEGIRKRSRHRRQRRASIGSAALVAVVALGALGLSGGGHEEQVRYSDSPGYTLDVYPQGTGSEPSIRTSGDPVLHLHIVHAIAQVDEVGQPEVLCIPDDAGRAAFAAVDPGQEIAFVVNGRLLSAPILTEHITDGEPILAGAFTTQQTIDLAHELTDNVTVETAG